MFWQFLKNGINIIDSHFDSYYCFTSLEYLLLLLLLRKVRSYYLEIFKSLTETTMISQLLLKNFRKKCTKLRTVREINNTSSTEFATQVSSVLTYIPDRRVTSLRLKHQF